jgi:hypothetical protein
MYNGYVNGISLIMSISRHVQPDAKKLALQLSYPQEQSSNHGPADCCRADRRTDLESFVEESMAHCGTVVFFSSSKIPAYLTFREFDTYCNVSIEQQISLNFQV